MDQKMTILSTILIALIGQIFENSVTHGRRVNRQWPFNFVFLRNKSIRTKMVASNTPKL